jgi:hypothetical protein
MVGMTITIIPLTVNAVSVKVNGTLWYDINNGTKGIANSEAILNNKQYLHWNGTSYYYRK